MREESTTPARRRELSSVADDYARHALSQCAAFEATHPAVLAAAERLANEPVLRVADLGAADGVNSHRLIRDLVAQRAGRALTYALVDLPTDAWRVAAGQLHDAFSPAAGENPIVVIPAPGETGPGIADTGTGAHYAVPEAHGEACRRALDRDPPPATVVSMAGIPLHHAPSLPPGTVHVAVTGTCMHWVPDAAGLASTGSPGHPDHVNEDERRAWRLAAERHWERLLADWCRAGRIDSATVEEAVVPVWARTLDEFRTPFEMGGGRFAGLQLESAELFRLDNPYRHDDPAVFAREYVQSVAAWGGPLLLRAFAHEGEARAGGLLAEFLGELQERVAHAPDRYRWDYIEALIICRKADENSGM